VKRIALLAVLFLGLSSAALAFTGPVVRVSDGDTIVVSKNGEQIRVRLYGIDTPEKRQVFGTQATRFVSQRVLHKTVRVDEVDTDRYGRVVAMVYNDGPQSLNEQLVQAGLAWVYERYCRGPECDTWLDMQRLAASRGDGLWQDPMAIPPWTWRKTRR
jgi:endonuclease YncB( thermonuclease family)